MRSGIEQLLAVVGGSMGGMQVLQWAADYPDACSRRCRSPPPRATRRRTSPSTKSAARRSWPIPNWRDGDYYGAGNAPDEGPGGGAHGGAHHLSVRDGAAAEIRPRAAGPRRQVASASTPTSRSKAICATRAPASSTGSTPIPTSTSPARWTISTSPRSMAGGSPRPSRAQARGSACSPSTPTGSTRPPNARDRPRAQRRRRAGQLRRAVGADGHDSFLLEVPALDRVVRGFLHG